MNTTSARQLLVEQLSPRYGAGEAESIARIVLEDAFGVAGKQGMREDALWTEEKQANLRHILTRLVSGEPVQYVLGAADFFGLKFRVNPAVLIPRQETEELVACVLEHLKSATLESPVLLDIGLGSGCIGVTLKKRFPQLRLFGLEKDPAALDTARENAFRILGEGASYQLLEGDILNRPDWKKFPALDVVVSNPPYIPYVEKNMIPEHVLAHEPALALFVSDDDPLLFYRWIADFSLEKLKTGGALFFECNEFNAGQVADLLRQKGFKKVQLLKDLAGADRIVSGIGHIG